uniref:Uncharacterized protein n=1 Tax=Ananas comosus var. bracteatus TaxID=296719 RepID=A0A6V7PYQ5_ANACO|nr:unnamed protein product [Ananas comosus var. bracteatus]
MSLLRHDPNRGRQCRPLLPLCRSRSPPPHHYPRPPLYTPHRRCKWLRRRVSEDAEKERGEELTDMVGGVLESVVEDEDEVPCNVCGNGSDAASCDRSNIGLHH